SAVRFPHFHETFFTFKSPALAKPQFSGTAIQLVGIRVVCIHHSSSFTGRSRVMREAYLAPLWMLGYGDSSEGAKRSQQPAATEPLTLEPDTVLLAELQTAVDASDAKPGDAITARVIGHTWRPTKGLLPAGSTLSGRVVEVRTRTQQDPESRLAICFDQA